jgi:hypothetical protein
MNVLNEYNKRITIRLRIPVGKRKIDEG